ncbi:hypothetical protein LB554_13740 [Mesorhizobium sp. CO1-1-11]|nr:hypothetical protein [Mesorhizobium sp. CO1-1-11]TPM04199.1 hypothetical protein FJ943_02125 [Mesorhizobium sp. B2-3-10]
MCAANARNPSGRCDRQLICLADRVARRFDAARTVAAKHPRSRP